MFSLLMAVRVILGSQSLSGFTKWDDDKVREASCDEVTQVDLTLTFEFLIHFYCFTLASLYQRRVITCGLVTWGTPNPRLVLLNISTINSLFDSRSHIISLHSSISSAESEEKIPLTSFTELLSEIFKNSRWQSKLHFGIALEILNSEDTQLPNVTQEMKLGRKEICQFNFYWCLNGLWTLNSFFSCYVFFYFLK